MLAAGTRAGGARAFREWTAAVSRAVTIQPISQASPRKAQVARPCANSSLQACGDLPRRVAASMRLRWCTRGGLPAAVAAPQRQRRRRSGGGLGHEHARALLLRCATLCPAACSSQACLSKQGRHACAGAAAGSGQRRTSPAPRPLLCITGLRGLWRGCGLQPEGAVDRTTGWNAFLADGIVLVATHPRM